MDVWSVVMPARGRARLAPIAAVVALAASPAGAGGQERVVMSGDLTLATEYVWRGLVRAARPALLADLYATVNFAAIASGPVRVDPVGITVGWWNAVQLGGVGPARLGDLEDGGVNELAPWAQVGGRAGPLDFAAGATRYVYRGDAALPEARTSDASTTELFARLGLASRRVRLGAAWWGDVDRVKGSYLETSLTLDLPFIPIPVPSVGLDPLLGNVRVEAAAGWNAGQEPNPAAPDELSNFAEAGLTHVRLSVSSSVLVGGVVSVDPMFFVQISRDPRTKRLAPGRSGGSNVYFALALRPVSLFTAGRVR